MARAQQAARMRRIGVFSNLTADDPEAQTRNAAFLQGLQELGWTVGRNVRIDYLWGAVGDTDQMRKYANELLSLAPDVIVTTGGSTVGPLQRATRMVPIVFANVIDPVGAGFIDSLARPGGNATGFMAFEYSIGGKWLALLNQIMPSVTRVAVLRDPANPSGIGLFAAVQGMASAFGLELIPVGARDAVEIEHNVAAFAAAPKGALIVPVSTLMIVHRHIIIALASRHRLPAIYGARFFAAEGGLVSYGHDNIDQFRKAAGYVDRILKGEKPADLPIQAPSKYELVLNLKTAKALGLTIPETLLATADEVIQ
jgi:putative ABC transport system substrate-binding protein